MSKGIDDKIGYTNATWSPAVGCSHLSPGCDHCLAARQASRGLHAPGRPSPWLDDEGQPLAVRGRWTGHVRCDPKRLKIPLGWKKPRRVLVPIMGDLFHPEVPFEFIDRVWAVMALCPQHTFLVLTKRPGRMLEWFSAVLPDEAWPHDRLDTRTRIRLRKAGMLRVTRPDGSVDMIKTLQRYGDRYADADHRLFLGPLRNVLLGTSVEDQERADERLPLLLQCPAVGHWASLEPLRSSVNVRPWLQRKCDKYCNEYDNAECPGTDGPCRKGLSFVALGAETGPGARPMDPAWARQVRDQCVEAGVAFWFKKGSDGSRELDGRKWEQFPEVE